MLRELGVTLLLKLGANLLGGKRSKARIEFDEISPLINEPPRQNNLFVIKIPELDGNSVRVHYSIAIPDPRTPLEGIWSTVIWRDPFREGLREFGFSRAGQAGENHKSLGGKRGNKPSEKLLFAFESRLSEIVDAALNY
jgi:hypothetical protein